MKLKSLILIIIIAISIVPILDLFHPGLPITHDGQDHVARIANFYKNLEEGNVIPRWAANLNWGYGHPILMFLYPLPSYIASFFHFFGFSLVDSMKLVFGLAFIASALAMYLFVNEFLGRWPGFAAALLYIFAPYRFVDLYVRGAIGEHVAFVFPPLTLFFLLKLSKNYSYWYVVGGSLSLAGLILSHNAISLMFLPIIFLYILYLLWQTKIKRLLVISYGLLVVSGLGLSAFFWMPAFFEGKYTLRDIVTAGDFTSRFVPFKNFIYGEWSYGISGQFTTQIGIVHWFIVILFMLLTVLRKRKKNNLWISGIGMVIIFWSSLFLMTEQAMFVWEKVTALQKFQFPWRILSITVFVTAVLGGIVCSVVPKNRQFVVCCLLFVVLFLFNKDYMRVREILDKPENFYTGIYHSTTDTGESSPIWSVRFMEEEPKTHMEVINGKASIKEIRRISTYHIYDIMAENKVRIRENTLYFPGWKVFVDAKETSVEFQDPAHRGLITFFIEEGKHIVEIKFAETKLRLFSNIVSIISFFIILFLSILKTRLIWQR